MSGIEHITHIKHLVFVLLYLQPVPLLKHRPLVRCLGAFLCMRFGGVEVCENRTHHLLEFVALHL